MNRASHLPIECQDIKLQDIPLVEERPSVKSTGQMRDQDPVDG